MRNKIGKRIKELRLENKLTQEQLAELANMSWRHLQLLEGKKTPNFKIDTLINITKAFKISLKDFFDF